MGCFNAAPRTPVPYMETQDMETEASNMGRSSLKNY